MPNPSRPPKDAAARLSRAAISVSQIGAAVVGSGLYEGLLTLAYRQALIHERGRLALLGEDMTKDQPFSATFKKEKETRNSVRYMQEAEGRPVVATVYVDKQGLPQPYPERIRVTVEVMG